MTNDAQLSQTCQIKQFKASIENKLHEIVQILNAQTQLRDHRHQAKTRRHCRQTKYKNTLTALHMLQG